MLAFCNGWVRANAPSFKQAQYEARKKCTQCSLSHPAGVRLECRPHGITSDGIPLYARTGKVSTKQPFPEDVVKCHAVVQALRLETCHLIYANKSYIIEREDNQWRKDLDECRMFLRENGY